MWDLSINLSLTTAYNGNKVNIWLFSAAVDIRFGFYVIFKEYEGISPLRYKKSFDLPLQKY